MVGGRAAVGVVLSVIIAACSPGTEPSPSATVAPDPTPTPATAGATADPMTPSPTATATSTPVPVPPKPTGLHLKWDEGYNCDPDWGGICVPETATFTLTWTAPRAKGVEVRVYGVTTCFRTDARTGACLRRHVALPDDTRVLLATGEAAKGRLRKRLSAEELFPSNRGCAIGWRSKDGTPFYSIVIAAYSVGGHSIFAIAEPGHYDRRGCEPDTY